MKTRISKYFISTGPKGPATRVDMTRRELENKLIRGPQGYTGWTGYYGGTGATGFTGKVLGPIHTTRKIKKRQR